MDEIDLNSLHNRIKKIESEVQQLADELTFAYELDPDFTLIEIAKMYTCTLNIRSKIYMLRPDLVPEHLKDADWHKYIPQ